MRNSAKPKIISSLIVLRALLVAWGFFAMLAFAPLEARAESEAISYGDLSLTGFAEYTASTLPSEEQMIATTTQISEPSTDTQSPTASATPAVEEIASPSSSFPPSPEPLPPQVEPLPPAPISEPSLSSPPPPPSAPLTLTPEPLPVEPVVPFTSTNGHAFDPATAPSKVRLKILNADGSAPMIPVFVTFVGVGGRTYGGPIDREGTIATIMPTGRYYADILVLDTKFGPPSNPPAFFLEANEERDFGALTLTDKSSFADEPLEREFATTLEGEHGFAKIFSLIVKLLLAILKELRGLRSELLGS